MEGPATGRGACGTGPGIDQARDRVCRRAHRCTGPPLLDQCMSDAIVTNCTRGIPFGWQVAISATYRAVAVRDGLLGQRCYRTRSSCRSTKHNFAPTVTNLEPVIPWSPRPDRRRPSLCRVAVGRGTAPNSCALCGPRFCLRVKIVHSPEARDYRIRARLPAGHGRSNRRTRYPSPYGSTSTSVFTRLPSRSISSSAAFRAPFCLSSPALLTRNTTPA